MLRGARELQLWREAPNSSTDLVVNLSTVLPYMQYRKKVRVYNGSYTPGNGALFGMVMLAMVVLWTFSNFFRQQYLL